MFVGYMRVSKADGSQTTDPQRDGLVEAGVDGGTIHAMRESFRPRRRLSLRRSAVTDRCGR